MKRTKVKKKYELTAKQVYDLLMERPNVQVWLWDSRYVIPDFESMMKIIKYDVVRWHQYRREVYDCDNFAVSFAGEIPFLYGVNNVGIVLGRVYDVRTGQFLGYHAWNVFIAMKEDGKLYVYMYEPQSKMFSSYKVGRIGNWRYEPLYILWG